LRDSAGITPDFTARRREAADNKNDVKFCQSDLFFFRAPYYSAPTLSAGRGFFGEGEGYGHRTSGEFHRQN
jgi:hypothetical protein